MNIAFIVNLFPALSESFILNQITGMIDLGHNVEIFAKKNPNEPKRHGDIEKYHLMDKVSYFEDIPEGKIRSIIKTLVLFFQYFKKDTSLLLQSLYVYNKYKYGNIIGRHYFCLPFLGKKFDIVQCHFGPNGNIGAYLKQSGFNIKVVTMFHGYDMRLVEKRGKDIYSSLKKYGDGYLAISSYNYNNMVDIGLDVKKIHYHPVGIDLNKYLYRSNRVQRPLSKNIIIITVGRLVEEKGFQYAIKAVQKIVEEHPEYNIEYRIVGDGPLRNSLNEITVRLGLKNHIKFLGGMDQDDVIRNLMDSDIFLLSSVAEALPVVLMESQAIGLPVVATDVGSVSEIVLDNKTGFLVQAKDIDGMKHRITYLIQNPERWHEMGRAGRANVESKYDINILNKKLERIFQKLIDSHST